MIFVRQKISGITVSFESYFFCFLLFYFVLMGLFRGDELFNWLEVGVGIPLIFYAFSKQSPTFKYDKPLLILFALYCVYFFIRSISAVDVSDESFEMVVRAPAHALIFFVCICIGFSGDFWDKKRELVIGYLVSAGVVIAIASIYSFYVLSENSILERLEPLGSARHSIMGTFYYAVPFFVAFMATFHCRGKSRLFFILASILLASVFYLTQSRMPVFSMAATVIFYFLFMTRADLLYKVSLLMMLLVSVFLVVLLTGVDLWLWRADSGRLDIWGAFFPLISEKVFWGYGNDMVNEIFVGPPWWWKHSHNVWLGHAYWGGLVAVCLLFGLYLRAAWLLWVSRESPLAQFGLCLLVFGAFNFLTDGHILLTRPSPIWLIFILPLALAMVVSSGSSKQKARKTGATPSVDFDSTAV